MKIRIEMDENLIEDEVVIYCANVSDEVMKVQRAIIIMKLTVVRERLN